MRLKIKNWSNFQHYKDRCPPWIKLHFKILHSRDWVNASDSDRVLAIASMLIASQDQANDGSFDADPDYFHRVAYLSKKPDFTSLIKNGFLEVVQNASESYQTLEKCTTETERETETDMREQKKSRSQKCETTIPEDFSISDSVREWANKNGYHSLDAHLSNFVDACLAKGYKYANWDAAFRNAIKGNWAKITAPKELTPEEANKEFMLRIYS